MCFTNLHIAHLISIRGNLMESSKCLVSMEGFDEQMILRYSVHM